MKKLFALFLLTSFVALNAQESANRFFYELSFKPQKDSARIEKVMMILDITKEKSIYRDYTMVAQDSTLKLQVEAMQKSGIFKDIMKSVTMPKFSEKVYKFYPDMKIQYVERIASGFTPMNIAYNDDLKFVWQTLDQKEKIGSYNTQKATTEFGGRKWTAWFTADIPLQDGPYKFYGLPGLIVKIEDEGKNYSWELKGNKKVANFNEITYLETLSPGGNGGKPQEINREKFDRTFSDFKSNPMATMKAQIPASKMAEKMQGSDVTIGEMIKEQEKMLKDFYGGNNNPIEISQPAATKANKK